MKILFVHQNFPGQFKHLAPALAAAAPHRVAALTLRKDLPAMDGRIQVARYAIARGNAKGVHPWVIDLETKVIRGEAALRAGLALKAKGYEPDVIVAHPGWGESLFLKEVWPQARLGLYCEFFYGAPGTDSGFDPEFVPVSSPEADARLRVKNVNNLMHFEIADGGLSPTHWQRSTFPDRFKQRISVAHDGVDTDALTPNPAATFTLPNGSVLKHGDEVVTFVNRNIEPYRGCHVFFRSLPTLMAQRPNAQFVVVGADGVSYGPAAPGGKTWKQIFLAEIEGRFDPSRLHFVGSLPYAPFIALLQVARVHVYLTYPFVLSWSLLEAMSVGAAIVASDTPPVLEVIDHDREGRLVNFFDQGALVQAVTELLDNPAARARLGAAARQRVVDHYDLRRICLPQQLQWVQSLGG